MILRKHLLLIFLIVVASFFAGKQPINAQQALLGPVLASRVVGGAWMTFEDVGSNRTWRVTLPDTSFTPQSWSSDGCNLLLEGSGRWVIMSIPDTTIREIPLPKVGSSGQSFGNLIWSFDGKSVTFTVYLSNHDVRIYSIDLRTFDTNLILSLDKSGGAVRWLSNTELLYAIAGGDYFVWDTIAKKSSLYQHESQIPSTQSADVYFSEESPNRERVATYYSINALHSFIAASEEIPPPDGINAEYVATLEAIPQASGFDIYTFRDNSSRHIDVAGQFLQFLVWSHSSKKIAVTTDPTATPNEKNGIYVYSLQSELLEKLDDFPAMENSEYGGYEPAWSPDDNLLAFNTPTGYIMYNLQTKKRIKLSEQFDGNYMNLEWSPTMDYSNVDC